MLVFGFFLSESALVLVCGFQTILPYSSLGCYMPIFYDMLIKYAFLYVCLMFNANIFVCEVVALSGS